MAKFDLIKARKAQEEYCERKGLPHFAPYSGNCWSCGRNIYKGEVRTMMPGTKYEKQIEVGITVEKAGKELITGCPHCNRSYCD